MHISKRIFRKVDLEQGEFYAEKLLRVLTKIVEKFCAFACKLVYVRGGLVDAVIESFVSYEFTDSAFASLGIG